MGYSFSNIHLKRTPSFDGRQAEEIAALIARGRGWELIDNPDEADVSTAVYAPEDGAWVSVVSDAFDGDPEAQLSAARSLAEAFHTDALAVSCFDSDYLFMNLINPERGVDLWASSGSAAAVGASGMRRSNYKAWKSRVADAEALARVMKAKHVFAEECMSELAEMLSLPAQQSAGTDDIWPEAAVRRFCYRVPGKAGSSVPPALSLYTQPIEAPEPGVAMTIPALNTGGASRGLAVVFAGECIDQQTVSIHDAKIQTMSRRGEWRFAPLELSERRGPKGERSLYGELRDFKLPEAVDGNLPWKKQMDKKFERKIIVRFTAENVIPDPDGERMSSLLVYMIPLANWEGQCGWQGRKRDTEMDELMRRLQSAATNEERLALMKEMEKLRRERNHK